MKRRIVKPNEYIVKPKGSFIKRNSAEIIVYSAIFGFVVNLLNNALLFKLLIKSEDNND
ncbi:hypothetical protein LZU01_06325 [Staphylococcus epidermidis]|uniref:hypothetical protein n=1 Tax=Staphylococcus epidermidis TaxID=1282 RepID=UPI0020960304|nr:hypothetical protein [Staphylococcus epidermidis]MCO6308943.1 hypothetical protein [Staphylococcus epidermidis]